MDFAVILKVSETDLGPLMALLQQRGFVTIEAVNLIKQEQKRRAVTPTKLKRRKHQKSTDGRTLIETLRDLMLSMPRGQVITRKEITEYMTANGFLSFGNLARTMDKLVNEDLIVTDGKAKWKRVARASETGNPRHDTVPRNLSELSV